MTAQRIVAGLAIVLMLQGSLTTCIKAESEVIGVHRAAYGRRLKQSARIICLRCGVHVSHTGAAAAAAAAANNAAAAASAAASGSGSAAAAAAAANNAQSAASAAASAGANGAAAATAAAAGQAAAAAAAAANGNSAAAAAAASNAQQWARLANRIGTGNISRGTAAAAAAAAANGAAAAAAAAASSELALYACLPNVSTGHLLNSHETDRVYLVAEVLRPLPQPLQEVCGPSFLNITMTNGYEFHTRKIIIDSLWAEVLEA
eukprot:jgi/Botrbrau1/19766/Bobra.0124s0018.1